MKRYDTISHIMIACVTITWLSGQDPISTTQHSTLPFNVTEIAEQVAHYSEVRNADPTIRQQTQHAGEWSRDGEFLIDTNIVYVPYRGMQKKPAIAFDGTSYLVVWTQYRWLAGWSIFGARIDSTGNTLAPGLIYISTGESPSAAFDGTNFMVVWNDTRGTDTLHIYACRIDQSGCVLDPDGILVSGSTDGAPCIAFDGENYLVVWQDDRNGIGNDIYGARITTEGTVLDPLGIDIAVANNDQELPSVAFDNVNNNYMVVWHDARSVPTNDIYGTRVTTSGLVLEPQGIAISTAQFNQQSPSITFDDDNMNFFVVWDDGRYGSADIIGARVDYNGVILDPYGILICASDSDQIQQIQPVVTSCDNIFMVSWIDDHLGDWSLYGARVSKSGIVLDPTAICINDSINYNSFAPAICFDGANSFVTWADDRHNFIGQIYGARIDQAGNVLDPDGVLLLWTANSQGSPAVASDGTNYLVVWEDRRLVDNQDICTARVDAAGNILDSAAIRITADANDQGAPAVAFDGTNYFIVWNSPSSDSSHIFGARINPAGVLIDSAGVRLSFDQQYCGNPAISFDGVNYLVVQGSGYHDPIRGTRVDQAGNVLDTMGIVLPTYTSHNIDPAIAFDGTQYFIAWGGHGCLPEYSYTYGARIDTSGTVLDSVAIELTYDTHGGMPAVAFDGTNFLAVWLGERFDYTDQGIYGTRVNQDGIVIDTVNLPISIGENLQYHPSIVFDNSSYFVAWEDYHNNDPHFSDIYGSQVNPQGQVIGTYAISLQNNEQVSPAIVCGPADSMLIIYSGWTDSINGQYASTMRIWGKFFPFTGTDEHSDRIVKESFLNIYPSPFSRLTTISYSAYHSAKRIELNIYDVTGRLVRSVRPTHYALRATQISWDGRDGSGKQLPSGVYFVRLETEDHDETRKLMLIR